MQSPSFLLIVSPISIKANSPHCCPKIRLQITCTNTHSSTARPPSCDSSTTWSSSPSPPSSPWLSPQPCPTPSQPPQPCQLFASRATVHRSAAPSASGPACTLAPSQCSLRRVYYPVGSFCSAACRGFHADVVGCADCAFLVARTNDSGIVPSSTCESFHTPKSCSRRVRRMTADRRRIRFSMRSASLARSLSPCFAHDAGFTQCISKLSLRSTSLAWSPSASLAHNKAFDDALWLFLFSVLVFTRRIDCGQESSTPAATDTGQGWCSAVCLQGQ